MPQLELLRPDHAPALLEFEHANRAYFAASPGNGAHRQVSDQSAS
jgi:hypothetical protein